MRFELIRLDRYETSDDPIELDDYSSGQYSNALYVAQNTDKKTFIYFEPDKNRPKAEQEKEPRCDFILAQKDDTNFSVRFIELKGLDGPEKKKCCDSRWEHGFHQLFCTYKALEMYMDLPNESFVFILCTSYGDRKTAARYNTYMRYKELREIPKTEIKVLFQDEYDTV